MRRTPKQQAIPAAMKTTAIGTVVEVTLDDGSIQNTATRSDPWQLGDGTWVVMLEGRIGGYDLARVSVPAEMAIPDGGPVEGMTALEVLDGLNEIMEFGDFIYDVRSRASEDEKWGRWDGDSWEHPMVVRWGQLCVRVAELIKDGEA